VLLSRLCFASTPQEEIKHLWLERFEGSETSLESMGWEGGTKKDDKLIDHFLFEENGNTFLRSQSIKNMEAENLRKPADWDVEKLPWVRWRWRVQKFPKGAKILDSKLSDAGAQVYFLWRNFPKHYVIKYFWASEDPVGTELQQSNFVVGTLWGIVLRSGGITKEWKVETRNLLEDFETAFEIKPPGKARGFAVLADADETKTEASADFDDFEAMASPENSPVPIPPYAPMEVTSKPSSSQ